MAATALSAVRSARRTSCHCARRQASDTFPPDSACRHRVPSTNRATLQSSSTRRACSECRHHATSRCPAIWHVSCSPPPYSACSRRVSSIVHGSVRGSCSSPWSNACHHRDGYTARGPPRTSHTLLTCRCVSYASSWVVVEHLAAEACSSSSYTTRTQCSCTDGTEHWTEKAT